VVLNLLLFRELYSTFYYSRIGIQLVIIQRVILNRYYSRSGIQHIIQGVVLNMLVFSECYSTCYYSGSSTPTCYYSGSGSLIHLLFFREWYPNLLLFVEKNINLKYKNINTRTIAKNYLPQFALCVLPFFVILHDIYRVISAHFANVINNL